MFEFQLLFHKVRLEKTAISTRVRQLTFQAWRAAVFYCVCAAVVISLGAVSSPVHAISGGTSSTQPWVVQVIGYKEGRPYVCSGSMLSSYMILTANHCAAQRVIFADGTMIDTAGFYPVKQSDIKVLLIKDEYKLKEYATLGPNYIDSKNPVPAGTRATVYGYDGGGLQTAQKKLTVVVENHGLVESVAGERAQETFYVSAHSGGIQVGDSGGPLVINGLLVGVITQVGVHPADNRPMGVISGLSPVFSVIEQVEKYRKARAFISSEL